ncbi:MAG: polyprenyl synthetase family protein [Desulfarculaceae bacterium]|nr:polyprenyl synthetase family protein [Desulfarculaceae bacterium]
MSETGFNLSEYLKDRRDLFNQYLKAGLEEISAEPELVRAMQYSITAGGKRLRPVLCMAAAECVFGSMEKAIAPAVAIEMIHTYSLIHDDLPAMDNDDLRRGKPTCHKKFSEATAVLAGDALLTHAFSILSNPGLICEESLHPENPIRIISRISLAAGPEGMVSGQVMDMNALKNTDSKDLDYLKSMHAMKTGAMIMASVETGALAAGGDDQSVRRLSSYAENIGMAFQVADDILNVKGDPAVMGKAAGSDAAADKMTFPSILGLEASRKYAFDLVSKAIDSLASFGGRADALREIATYIIERDR